MAVLLDSYSESNKDANGSVRSGGAQGVAIGQSFLASQTIQAYSLKFYLEKVGSPTGTIYGKLFSHSGVFGVSSAPDAELASGSLDVSTITTSGYNLYEFLLSAYEIQNLTNYMAIVEYSGGDSSNYVNVGIDVSTPIHAGNIWSETGGADAAVDGIFYAYGQDTAVKDPIGSGLVSFAR